ncbi:MAG: glycoside hydrolase family 31 protein [Paenibacillus macerans]|uniref:glycoside hydrolase family 31 protein n=1 Tax=Paenibacillus macerans TaxID=44252 RepID=UPI00290BA01D|nr:TIM-barrel domain-containing protein [Paenibacillus macerans]MDU7473955.1 glycoside hydrolase family 31 protein [Paenibacillus macerans]
MRLTHFHTEANGVTLNTSAGIMQIAFCTPGIAGIRYTLDSEFSGKQSLMVVNRPERQDVQLKVADHSGHLEISTELLKVMVDKSTCAFSYWDSSGSLLAAEPSGGGKTLERTDVYRTIFDASADGVETDRGADGFRARAEGMNRIFDRQAYHTKLEFDWQAGEALYGLGSHEEGMMNLRGKHQYLYQQNMKAVIPALLSTRGYGILVDSYSYMSFHDDSFGSYIWTDVDDEMEFYFIYGPEFDQIIAGIRYLTGEAPMLPKWAYGYVQSKERYVSQEELIDTVQEYRGRGLPLDCIVLDWQSWTGELWGQKTLDPQRFPDPSEMMRKLHALNAKLMVSIWPIMKEGGDNHREMSEHGFLLGNQATYDAFTDEARRLYWKQAHAGLFSHGIDAWWCDCTEPFEADWKGAVKPEPEQRMLMNTAEAKLYLDPEYINAYSLLHSKGIYEGQRSVTDGKRVVNLTRSAYAGQHRYGAVTWSGDISANWETLRKQIADGLNFCAAGSPYWTLDIGAFFVHNHKDLWFWNGDYNDGVADLGYRELYVRWFQLGACLPMFRSHGTDTPREIWQFGEPGEPFYDTLAKYLKLRYRLLPYIYSLAGAVAHHSYTMLRALAFDYREDARVHDIDDQFMLGPAFLVAPVTTAMYYGPGSRELQGVSKSRSVYLPAGEWYDYWTDERIEGGQTREAKADLETLPLFVRAGSIIPVGPDVQYADERPEAVIRLKVYPGKDAEFTLYEDEGDTYNYEAGAYSTIEMRWCESDRTLTIGGRTGSYDGMPGDRQFAVEIAGKSGQSIVSYQGDPVVVREDEIEV